MVSDHVLVGGIDECNPQLYTFLKHIISELRSQNLINIPEIFNENIDRCFHQLVNGNIFQTVLKIDGRICRFYVWKSAIGKFSVMDRSIK